MRRLELLCLFVLFVVYGAWSIPDSNEPYYVLKAVRFWQSDFLANDTFLATRDAHTVFYLAFGWLSFFLTPEAMAWTGRLVAWLLMAWTWQRLAHAVLETEPSPLVPSASVSQVPVSLVPVSLVPVSLVSVSPFAVSLGSVVAASLFAFLLETCHFAGEWIFGGVEGKSFAFPFLFLGLEQLVRGQWRRVWICLGAASAFHVLVGGWGVVAAGVAWLLTPRGERTPFVAMVPSLAIGGLVSLAGLVPVLTMNRGVPQEVVAQAAEVYVFVRLAHHLVPHLIPWAFAARFGLLVIVTLLLALVLQRSDLLGRPAKLLVRFTFGAIGLAAIGVAIDFITQATGNRSLAAQLLRFYWFRLSDVAVPLAAAMLATLVWMRMVVPQLEAMWAARARVVRESMAFLAAAFVVFVVIDATLFGWLWFSWDRPVEPMVAWLAVLAIGLVMVLVASNRSSRRAGTLPQTLLLLLTAAFLFWWPATLFVSLTEARTRFPLSRIDGATPFVAYHWRDVCLWIAAQTRADARFLVPRESATFKWHAHRADVGVWKELPQDAASIVAWRATMTELFAQPLGDAASEDDASALPNTSLGHILASMTDDQIAAWQKKYQFEYVVVSSYPPQPPHGNLRLLYDNSVYQVYEFQK